MYRVIGHLGCNFEIGGHFRDGTSWLPKILGQDLPQWENALVVGIDQNHRSGFGTSVRSCSIAFLTARTGGTDDLGRDSLSGADSCHP